MWAAAGGIGGFTPATTKAAEAARKAASNGTVVHAPEYDSELTAQKVRKLVPKILGIRVKKDITYYYRWQMVHPGKPPEHKTKTSSKTFAEAGGDVEAFRWCLKELWAFHKEVYPESEGPSFDIDTLDP